MNLISNPPFNMKWIVPPFAQMQRRFQACAIPPETNANYAFVLTALDMVDEKAVFILPGGFLTSDNKQEKSIRKYLVQKNYIETVIACPDKMFESTGIPICIVVFNKKKETTKTGFMDMCETYHEDLRVQRGQYGGKSHENRVYKKKIHYFSDQDIQKAIETLNTGKDITGFYRTVGIQDIENKEYNLSPNQYIEQESKTNEHRDYSEIVKNINAIRKERNCLKLTINWSAAKVLGMEEVCKLYEQNKKTDEDLENTAKLVGERILKDNYLTVSKNKNEIKFENNSKETISTILLSIMQMYKQHIIFLNNEENRYLAEFRDALLEDLMSGKIDISEHAEV